MPSRFPTSDHLPTRDRRASRARPQALRTMSGALLAAAAATFAAAPAASAQAQLAPPAVTGPMGGPFGSIARPTFSPADVAFFTERLDLRSDQQAAVAEMLTEYAMAFVRGRATYQARVRSAKPDGNADQTAYREAQEATREQIRARLDRARAEAARAGDPDTADRIIREAEREMAAMRAELAARLTELAPGAGRSGPVGEMLVRMQELARDRLVELDELDAALLAEVSELLDEPQAARLPAVERAVRRRMLPSGRLSAERSDLGAIVVKAVPGAVEDPAIAERLLAWERALDDALRQRRAALPAVESRIARLQLEADADPSLAGRLDAPSRRRVELHRRVRDVTISAAESIAAMLSEADSARFVAAWREDAFPTVSRSSPIDRLFASIDAAFEDGREDLAITPDERATAARLSEAWRTERTGLDAAIIAATIRAEPIALERARTGTAASGADADPGGESAAWRARRERAASYADAIRSLLGDDRFTRLPGSRTFRR